MFFFCHRYMPIFLLFLILHTATAQALPTLSTLDPKNFQQPRTWAVVQYDSRELSGKITKLLKQNQIYCTNHNYTYFIFNSGFEDVPVYWRKVKLVQALLSLRTDSGHDRVFQGVMWLDTDAFVWDHENFTLPGLLPDNASFAYASDPDSFVSFSPFNAGVWLVRNSRQGRSIMKKWISLYDPGQWQIVSGDKWVSQSGVWAGEDFEQGSFAQHMMSSPGLHELPWFVLHGIPGFTDNRSFTMHFCSIPNALSAGLVKVDGTIVQLLRIKYKQSIKAQMHRTYMQFLRINFAVALLRHGSETQRKKLLREAESVLLDELGEDPSCQLCTDNLKAVRNHLEFLSKTEF